MSADAAVLFGSFVRAHARKRPGRRRGLAVLLSAVGHGGVLLVLAAVTLPREATPRAPEPVLVRLAPPRFAAAEKPLAPETPPTPRPARRPPRPAVVQPPPELPPPPVEPEPVPEEVPEEPEAAEEDAGEPEPAPAAGSAAGRTGGLAGGTGDAVLELRDVARAPSVLEQVKPEYPADARWKGIEGMVVLRVVIGLDGRVERGQTRVIRSVPALDAAAIAALERWRFSPAIGHAGKPVRVLIEVPIRFSLR